MLNKILGILFVVFQMAGSALGCNQAQLDQEAGAYNSRIWSDIDSPESVIRKSLYFVHDKDLVDPKYAEDGSFGKLYTEATKQVPNRQFLLFAANGKSIFDQGSDAETKMPVYLLLEKVRDKSLVVFKHMKKAEELKEKERREFESRGPEAENKHDLSERERRVMDFLRGADKNTISAIKGS